MPHLAPFATLGFAVEVHARAGDGERGLGEGGDLGEGGGRAEDVEHARGGDLERSGAEWEGEDGAEVVLVLGGLASFNCVVAGVVWPRCNLIEIYRA